MASEVSSGLVPTLNTDSNITISVNDVGVMLDGTANVIATDVQGSNGFIYAIDGVILPN